MQKHTNFTDFSRRAFIVSAASSPLTTFASLATTTATKASLSTTTSSTTETHDIDIN
jgi:hypothetical protein